MYSMRGPSHFIPDQGSLDSIHRQEQEALATLHALAGADRGCQCWLSLPRTWNSTVARPCVYVLMRVVQVNLSLKAADL